MKKMNYAACVDQVSLREDRVVSQANSLNRIKRAFLELSLLILSVYFRIYLNLSSMGYYLMVKRLPAKGRAPLVEDLKKYVNKLRMVLNRMESYRRVYDSIWLAGSRRNLGAVARIFDERIDDLEISLSKKLNEAFEQVVTAASSGAFDIERVHKVDSAV